LGKLRFAQLAFLLLLTPILTHSRPVNGVLDGVVLSGKGAPVAFAEVFWQTADFRAPHAVRANRSGYFRIAGLRQGLYEVRAQGLGMTSEWEHNVWVPAGREANVTLRLTHRTAKSGSAK
jgi:Carboxypeptidase regulatory-like domain